MSVLTAGSLFSGIGGIDVAFATAGFDIRFQVEIDPFCRKVLAKHAPRYWPNAAQHVDVCRVGRAELGSVDVLFGGFPCQDISVAGNGAGLEGERSGLWYEFRRLIGDLRPRIVFVENVPAITSRGGTTVIAHLTALGYDARWGIVGAADAGAPHQRDRWFCMAHAQHDGCTAAPFAGRDAKTVQHGAYRSNRPGEFARGDHSGSLSITAMADANGLRRQEPTAPADSTDSRVGYGTARQPAGQHEQRAAVTDSQILRYGARTPSQSRLGRNPDGIPAWLDRPQFPAGSGQSQHAWEPPRQVEKRPADWAARVKALGNAVVPQVVYPFAVEIARLLESESAS
jgi:DNA (cytosine-5)-methyltransferase 1